MFLAGPESPNESDVYKIIHWDSFMILPRHVAFKGDNGKYLGVHTYRDTLHFLEFSFTDIGNPAIGHEVSVVRDGCLRIKSDYNGKYWGNSTSWVQAESDKSGADDDSSGDLYWPVKVGENTIALCHIGRDRFCRRVTDYWEDCLNAGNGGTSITKEAKLVVEEFVVSRDIYNIEYHIKDARIYEGERITLDTLTATNRTNGSDTAQLNFEHTDIISSTWTNHIWGTFGVKVEFEATIPIVGDGNIEISASVTGGRQWGKPIGTEQKHSTLHTVTLPPMSKVKVIMVATKGKCRLPFSYTQLDTLTNGQVVITQQNGGIYTAENCFNYCFEKVMEPL